jgi:uncharacterized protein involved in outer membrane biogenesis
MGISRLKNPFAVWKNSGPAAKTAAIIAGIYVLYVLLGFFLMPVIVRDNLQERIARHTQRETEINAVDFNPFTLGLTVQGVKIKQKENSDPLFSMDLLQINLQASSLFRRTLVLKELRAVSPSLDISFYGRGEYSISDLFPAKENKEDSTTPKETRLFPFFVQDINVSNGTLRFRDQPREKTHVIDKFNFVLPRISSMQQDRDEHSSPRLDFRINGDPVNLNAKMLPFASSRQSRIQVDFSRVNLTPYWIYSPLADSIQLENGSLEGSLIFEFKNTPEGIRINLSGKSSLRDIVFSTKKEGRVLECDLAELSLQRFSPMARILEIQDIKLGRTKIKISRDKNKKINWEEYILSQTAGKETAANEQAKTPEAQKTFNFSCNKISLPDIRIEMEDTATPVPFNRNFRLSAELKAIDNSPGKTGKGTLRLTTEGKERMDANASLDIAGKSADMHVDFSAVPANEYTPYFREYIPWDLASCEASGNGDLTFNPSGNNNLKLSNGTLHLDRIQVKKPDGSFLLKNENLRLQGISLDKEKKNVLLESLRMRDGGIKLVRLQNGDLDVLSDIREMNPKQEKESGQTETGPEKEWEIQLKELILEEIDTGLKDLKAVKPVDLSLQTERLVLNNLRLPSGKDINFVFTGQFNKQGGLNLSGTLDISPFKAEIKGRAEKIDLVPADAYLPDSMRMDIRSCFLNADFNAHLKHGEELALNTKVDGSLTSLDIRDIQQKQLLRLKQMDINGLDLGLNPNELHISKIVLDSPGIDLEQDSGGNLNFKKALGLTRGKNATSKDPGDKKDKEPFFQTVQVDTVRIENGSMLFKDKNVSPYYETRLTNIECVARTISQEMEEPGRLSLNATKDAHSRLTLSGEINPLAKQPYSDLEFSLQGMDMVSLTPYTIEFMAYPIQTGKLNWNGNFKVQNSTLKGENLFLIENMALGSKMESEDAANVPVKLALALLQDSRGDMELDIPISGNLNDPQFSLGKVIFQAIIGLFGKIATAPFALIGNIFGGGEDVNRIPYEPGKYILTAEAEKKLQSIITALKKRPRLRLSIQGHVDMDKDTRVLLQERLLRKLRLEKIEDMDEEEKKATDLHSLKIGKEEYPEYLSRAYKKLRKNTDKKLPRADKISETEMENLLRAQAPVSKDDLQELALDRARSIRAYIVGKDPELGQRIFLRHGSEKDLSKEGKAEAVLSIK